RALDLDLAHVRDVEDAGVGAHGPMLGDDAFVLDGHLPPGERDHPCAESDVAVVEWRAPQRLHPVAMLEQRRNLTSRSPSAAAGSRKSVLSVAEPGRDPSLCQTRVT